MAGYWQEQARTVENRKPTRVITLVDAREMVRQFRDGLSYQTSACLVRPGRTVVATDGHRKTTVRVSSDGESTVLVYTDGTEDQVPDGHRVSVVND